MKFETLFQSKKNRIILISVMLSVFLIVGVLNLFLYRLMDVRFNVALYNVDENGEYYEVSSSKDYKSDYGYIDGGMNTVMYVDNFMELYTVKAYAAPGYRFLMWEDGNESAEIRCWMHFGVYKTAYFIPDRETDAKTLNVSNGTAYVGERTEQTWDHESFSYESLGEAQLKETDYGFTLSMKNSSLVLLPIHTKEEAVSYSLASILMGENTTFYELFDDTSYKGLFLALSSSQKEPNVTLGSGDERSQSIAYAIRSGVMKIDGRSFISYASQKVSSRPYSLRMDLETLKPLSYPAESIMRVEAFKSGTNFPFYAGTEGWDVAAMWHADQALFRDYRNQIGNYANELTKLEQTIRNQF